MTERHLRCGADGCHFCCCCKNKHDRLGCLRRHVLWHLQNWFTLPLPPRKTILLLDELEAWEDNEIEKNNQIKNEFEKKNENNDKNEDEETSSSCDGDKEKQNNDFNENRNKYKANLNVKFKKKYKYHYKYFHYHEAAFNFRVYARHVAYTRIITDSFRVYDRGRHSGHDVPNGLNPPVHLPPHGR